VIEDGDDVFVSSIFAELFNCSDFIYDVRVVMLVVAVTANEFPREYLPSALPIPWGLG
jgi:hypothetical protein